MRLHDLPNWRIEDINHDLPNHLVVGQEYDDWQDFVGLGFAAMCGCSSLAGECEGCIAAAKMVVVSGCPPRAGYFMENPNN